MDGQRSSSQRPTETRDRPSCSSPLAPTSPPKTATGAAARRIQWLSGIYCVPRDLSRVCGRETALMWAVGYGHAQLAELLIAAGADVAAEDNHGCGCTPKKMAVRQLCVTGSEPSVW